MTHELSALAATLLNNFITVRFPRSDAISELMQLPEGSRSERRHLEYAVAADNLIILCHRGCLRTCLAGAGYWHYLDRLGIDSAGDWVIHLYFADAATIPLAVTITEGAVSPGDPAKRDPKPFIERRLRILEQMNRLTGAHPWWDTDY